MMAGIAICTVAVVSWLPDERRAGVVPGPA
jgi:hypothetical protein